MSDRGDRVDRALASLKRVDDERLDSLTSDRAAQALFEEVVSMDGQEPMPRKHGSGARRRTLLLRAGIAAAAVAALVGVLSVIDPFGSSGLTTVEQAAAALAPQQGTILHIKMLGRQMNPDGSVVTWSDESWQASEAPFDRRQIEIGPEGTSVETAIVDGLSQVYDPAADTIYAEAPVSAPSAPVSSSATGDSQKHMKITIAPGPSPGTVTVKIAPTEAGGTVTLTNVMSKKDAELFVAKVRGDQPVIAAETQKQQAASGFDDPFRAKILAMLRSGAVREDGRLTVDGRPAIRLVAIVGEPGDTASLSETLLVDAGTYDPIEWRTSGDGGGTVLRFVVYEQLPNTTSSRALLSLTAQHPGAHIDRDPAHYQAAQERLFPNG